MLPSPIFHQSLCYVYCEPERTCANCRRSHWGTDSRGQIRVPDGMLACFARRKAVLPNGRLALICPYYLPPRKSFTLFVEACYRDSQNHVVIPLSTIQDKHET